MVKTRRTTDVEPSSSKPEQSQIRDFATRAEVGEYRPRPSSRDPKAPRKYKTMTIPFNRFEFETLEAAADKAGRAKMDFMRRAMLEYARRVLDKKESNLF